MDIDTLEFDSTYQNAKSFHILDVREELEYNTFNLGGTNIPLGRLIREIDDLEFEKDQPLVVLCQHGIRSETARKVLEQAGYVNVRNLKNGILGWRKLNQRRQ